MSRPHGLILSCSPLQRPCFPVTSHPELLGFTFVWICTDLGGGGRSLTPNSPAGWCHGAQGMPGVSSPHLQPRVPEKTRPAVRRQPPGQATPCFQPRHGRPAVTLCWGPERKRWRQAGWTHLLWRKGPRPSPGVLSPQNVPGVHWHQGVQAGDPQGSSRTSGHSTAQAAAWRCAWAPGRYHLRQAGAHISGDSDRAEVTNGASQWAADRRPPPRTPDLPHLVSSP